MGKPQGDELPDPVRYVRRNENGELEERNAYSNADHVNLKARGWVREDETERPEKRAGSQQHGHGSRAERPAAAPDGTSNV